MIPPIKARPTTPPTTEPAITPVLLLGSSCCPALGSEEGEELGATDEALGSDDEEGVELVLPGVPEVVGAAEDLELVVLTGGGALLVVGLAVVVVGGGATVVVVVGGGASVVVVVGGGASVVVVGGGASVVVVVGGGASVVVGGFVVVGSVVC